jgi:hypothetical protein
VPRERDSETVFDADALTQILPTLGCRYELSESVLQLFVFGKADRASRGRCHRTVVA